MEREIGTQLGRRHLGDLYIMFGMSFLQGPRRFWFSFRFNTTKPLPSRKTHHTLLGGRVSDGINHQKQVLFFCFRGHWDGVGSKSQTPKSYWGVSKIRVRAPT